MWRAVATDADVVCFLDADTADPTHHLLGLLGPLLAEPGVQFVRAPSTGRCRPALSCRRARAAG